MSQDRRRGAHHGIALLVVLLAVWLLWSGHYTLSRGLLAVIAVLSCVSVVLLARRMGLVDEEGQPMSMGIRPLFYVPWLAMAILKANLDVTRRILSPELPLSPTLEDVPAPQRTDLGTVIFANSITLTPGTVSVDVGEGRILVHSISREGMDELLEGEMSTRVRRLEGEG